MKEEVNLWLRQSEKDFEVAEKNFKINEFYSAVFWSQQSAEKGLKAVYIFKNNSLPPRIHDLVELCRLIKAPDEIISNAGKLVVAYIFSRYPGAAPKIPEEYYDKKKTEEHLSCAKEILEWVKKQII